MTLAVPRLHQVETWRRRESRNGVSLAGLAPGRNGSVGLYQVPPLGSPVPPSQCQLSSPILHATPQVLARSPGSPRGVSRRPGGAVTARPSEPRKGTPPPTSRPSFPRGRCPLSGAEMPYGRCRYPAQPRGLLLGGSDLLRQTERPPPPHTHTRITHTENSKRSEVPEIGRYSQDRTLHQAQFSRDPANLGVEVRWSTS